jgi:hypothetical protein
MNATTSVHPWRTTVAQLLLPGFPRRQAKALADLSWPIGVSGARTGSGVGVSCNGVCGGCGSGAPAVSATRSPLPEAPPSPNQCAVFLI